MEFLILSIFIVVVIAFVLTKLMMSSIEKRNDYYKQKEKPRSLY